MSSSKRRRLDSPPQRPPLSAFAARQALQSNPSSTRSPRKQNTILSHAGTAAISRSFERASGNLGNLPQAQKDTDALTPIHSTIIRDHGDTPDSYEDGQLKSSLDARSDSPEILLEPPSIPLSSFKPSKINLKDAENGMIQVTLAPGERLVIVGQYELCVRRGQITLMGSVLIPSKTFYRVFAASSHSLPVIRCLSTDITSAEVFLRVCRSGLDLLKKLSPLFGRLWNDQAGPLGSEYEDLLPKLRSSTFQILFSTKLDLNLSYMQPLISPPEWNLLLSKFSDTAEPKKRIIMICGPKSSGKSTFAKILGNRLLSEASTSSSTSKGVAFIDIDPGQPEYSPPGQLALVHIRDPNFGGPFSHPIPGGKSNIIRAHAIGSISPALDPSLYMSCVLDLALHYRMSGSAVRDCPLIINTPGWVFGTGLEILVDLIAKVKPTDVVYMSQEGPPEVHNTLKTAANPTPLYTLPSQISEYTTRTSAHLRTMQAMSYFHLDPRNKTDLAWNDQPLTTFPPWEVRYTGDNPGILGIMCYGEQPTADLLAEAINGSLVAVVIIDDMAAIPSFANEDLGLSADDATAASDADLRVTDQLQTPHPEQPSIIHTPAEHIPYFNPSIAITLDPQYSHSIGLALVRGIDVARQRIQLLTPIAPSVIEEINEAGKAIVLVSGKLDTPGWAYMEDLNLKAAEEKEARKGDRTMVGVEDDDEDEDEDDNVDMNDTMNNEEAHEAERSGRQGNSGHDSEDAPWVEKLQGSQGRGVGSRVWRVRRDLGRVGDGGE